MHAYYEAPVAGGYWGTLVTPYCFNYSADDRNVANYLQQLRRRAVEVDRNHPLLGANRASGVCSSLCVEALSPARRANVRFWG